MERHNPCDSCPSNSDCRKCDYAIATICLQDIVEEYERNFEGFIGNYIEEMIINKITHALERIIYEKD
jgi:hypothetical protein